MPWACPLDRGEGEGEVGEKRGVKTPGHILQHHVRFQARRQMNDLRKELSMKKWNTENWKYPSQL